jgi:alpha-amylase
MGRKTLLLAFHNHQPDGNFDEVFAKSHDECYRPVVDLLLDFPRVRCSLHFTGALLEWMERHRADTLGKMRTLTARGQVEMLGGGFYEPMLAVLPDRDALGQLRMMSDYLEQHFGTRPRGMWLAERVWEPGLPRLIDQVGLRYTMLDDGHFRYAGIEGRLSGYYTTEKAGSPTAIFPIDKDLRYAIPFRQAHEVVDLLASLPDGAYTYGDDGEKFGLWPGTKEWVWEKGWLRTFFGLLSERTDLIETTTFSEYLDSAPPSGRVYLPTASYEEMGEWSLPAAAQERHAELREALTSKNMIEQARPFLRGGIWQNFLVKYDEANFMHKKMVYVSDKIALAEAQTGKQLDGARRELYRAQCNCSYWHGLFGGLYLGYLRHRVYSRLIAAETEIERLAGPQVVRRDYDADLQEEVLLESPALNVYVRPAMGGAVCELDDRAAKVNLCGVLSRREEGYHRKLREAAANGPAAAPDAPKSIHDLAHVKEAGLENLLVVDRHLRLGFVDHFLPAGITLDQLVRVAYDEAGDFVAAPYRVLTAENGRLELERQGTAYGRPLKLRKEYELRGRTLVVTYRLEAGQPVEVSFAPELSLFIDTAEQRSAGATDMGEVAAVPIQHDWLGLSLVLRVSPATRVLQFPLETASQSEGGFERTYQGTVFQPVFRQALAPQHPFEVRIELGIANA